MKEPIQLGNPSSWDEVSPHFINETRFIFLKQLQAAITSEECTPIDALATNLEIMKIANPFVAKNAYWRALHDETTGEIKLAVRPDYINKWGIHYLRSLFMAHSMQLRNNFKDIAIQHYGMQPELEAIRCQINDVFNGLPAPRASLANGHSSGLPSLASYNTASNGCFAGSCVVLATVDPFTVIPYPKPISQLKIGEYIATSTTLQNFAQITHIAIMHNSTQFDVVKFQNGLITTPYHPVKYDGQWQFPADIIADHPEVGELVDYDEEVYNFALDGADYAEIHGMIAIALGHQITDNPVAAHPYFGSSLVLNDLDDFNTDEWGRVHLTAANIQRDPATNKIIRYVAND
jgi:hypothetical protein